MQKLTVGLIGNPNSGKTTLFNQLTGARQRVGNWAGVTVERKEGIFATTDHQVTLVDLPGTYSLTTISSQTSLDEQIACHYILSGDADMLINVVDASNLERNLYLTLQLARAGDPLRRRAEHAGYRRKAAGADRYRRPRRPSRLPGHSAGIDSRTGDRSAEDRPRPSSGEQRS